ncbi:MAG: class I SAM-dependent methyltransferase, partial [Actinomycetota bacterium]|nr:class I SAM-dependent methyltransferase [Actinomycetota bacterium]
SGAGLPGIPLAIRFPLREWRLLEPRRKRAAFLEEAVRALALPNVTVLPLTAEAAARDPHLRDAHPLVVARALAPPVTAIELLLPLVLPGGRAAILVADGAIPPNSTRWGAGIATVMRGPTDGKK